MQQPITNLFLLLRLYVVDTAEISAPLQLIIVWHPFRVYAVPTYASWLLLTSILHACKTSSDYSTDHLQGVSSRSYRVKSRRS
jgi:hypothetical protein